MSISSLNKNDEFSNQTMQVPLNSRPRRCPDIFIFKEMFTFAQLNFESDVIQKLSGYRSIFFLICDITRKRTQKCDITVYFTFFKEKKIVRTSMLCLLSHRASFINPKPMRAFKERCRCCAVLFISVVYVFYYYKFNAHF